MGKHTSLDTKVKKNIEWVKSIPCVSKIVIGISESCRHKFPPGHIRFRKDVSGGIKINAYSGNGVTDIYIKVEPISEREKLKALILKRWNLKS